MSLLNRVVPVLWSRSCRGCQRRSFVCDHIIMHQSSHCEWVATARLLPIRFAFVYATTVISLFTCVHWSMAHTPSYPYCMGETWGPGTHPRPVLTSTGKTIIECEPSLASYKQCQVVASPYRLTSPLFILSYASNVMACILQQKHQPASSRSMCYSLPVQG